MQSYLLKTQVRPLAWTYFFPFWFYGLKSYWLFRSCTWDWISSALDVTIGPFRNAIASFTKLRRKLGQNLSPKQSHSAIRYDSNPLHTRPPDGQWGRSWILALLKRGIEILWSDSLRIQPFLLVPRRLGRFARRNVCASATEILYWWRKICPESGRELWLGDIAVILFYLMFTNDRQKTKGHKGQM